MTDKPGPNALATSLEGPLTEVPCPRCACRERRLRYVLRRGALVSCCRCGMTYVSPRLDDAHLERKLQLWSEQDVVDRERLRIAFAPETREYYARFLARISAHTSGTGRRLLDVGCSTGCFMTVARDAGWKVRGIEIGRAAAAYARESQGLDVSRGTLYSFDPGQATYDALTMIEVIEHLTDPRTALEQVRRWLCPGGLVLVTTPNFDSLYRRLFGTRWWVVNCEDEHIVLFTMATLEGMLRETGFEIVDRHIQNLDMLGLLREWRSGRTGRSVSDAAESVENYYQARSAKTRVKAVIDRFGFLHVARALMRGLDATYSMRFSPTRGWGEQLVVVARRAL